MTPPLLADDVEAPAWERLAPFAGLAFVVLDVLIGLAGGEPPHLDDGGGAVAAHYREHADGIEAGLWLFGPASILLMLWFAGLWRWMVRAERGVPGLAVASMLGLAIAGALSLAGSAVWAAAALQADTMALSEVASFHLLGVVLSSASGVGVAAHLLATNGVGRPGRRLPTWLLVVGVISAIGWLAQLVAASTSTSDAAGAIGLAAFVLWCAWILGVSRQLWVDRVGR